MAHQPGIPWLWTDGTYHRPHTSPTNVRWIQWHYNIHKTSWSHCHHLNPASVQRKRLPIRTNGWHSPHCLCCLNQPATEPPTRVTSEAQSPFNDLTAEEPYAGFNTQIQQILSDADALHNEVERQGLKEVLLKYKDSFAKDSLDCGLTRHPHGAHTDKPKCTTHLCATVQDSDSVIWASARNCWLHAGKGGHPAL